MIDKNRLVSSDSGSALENWSSIIRKAKTGCRESFGILATSYWEILIQEAHKALNEDLRVKIAPSDLVQQTLILTYQSLSDLEGSAPADFERWIKHILRNQAASAGRFYRGTQSRTLRREVRLTDLEEELEECKRTPPQKGQDLARLLRFQGYLNQLPPNYRVLIVKRSLELKSFEEVGKETGRTADAARKMWVRAFAALQKIMTDANEGNSNFLSG